MGNAKTKEILTKFFEFNMIGESDIAHLFDTYDKNHNGVLEWDEAEHFLTDMMTLAIKRTRTEIEKKKKKGSATELEEKQLEWAEDREKNLPKFVKECFDALDVDGNGTIDKKEFASYFKENE
jgi:Ca2+-binding EF-hand superfamily protein